MDKVNLRTALDKKAYDVNATHLVQHDFFRFGGEWTMNLMMENPNLQQEMYRNSTLREAFADNSAAAAFTMHSRTGNTEKAEDALMQQFNDGIGVIERIVGTEAVMKAMPQQSVEERTAMIARCDKSGLDKLGILLKDKQQEATQQAQLAQAHARRAQMGR